MKPMHRSFAGTSATLLASALLAPALLLSGCGGNVSFPDTVVPGTAQQTPLGKIQGSVYGGHAPLTTAHVYVLQPSTSGYGNQATSLLGASASSAPGYATFQNTGDPGIPSGAYYVETDGSGQFSITGDYTCTAGVPVYLYSYGGFADYPSSGGYGTNNTFNISSVSVSGSAGSYTYTFTTTTAQYGYAGETVYFNQTYGPFTGGSDYTIASDNSNTTFTLTSTSNSTSSVSGLQATITPVFNPGIVNLAVLGVCPSSGNFTTGGTLFNGSTFSPLNYVYINEVSTVAAAYAFAPFSSNANLSGGASSLRGNYASYIGTSSTNLVGLQNAALNAGMLYSVNGSGPVTSNSAGEGHIANATTPTGNGIINQATIDTVANILASCVDSYSTSTDASNYRDGISTQCLQLFVYATNTGVPFNDPTTPGIQPYDTATAAINIALHPQGPPASYTSLTPSAWVAVLYNLPTGNVPFSPNLTSQPNDFTVGILYPQSSNSVMNGVTGVAVDKIGEVWFTDQPSGGGGYIFEMSPQGVVNSTYTTYLPNGYVPGPPVIDARGDVWIQPQNVQAPTYFIQATSTSGNPYVYSTGTPTAAGADSNGYFYSGTEAYFGDNSGNMWFLHDQVAPGASGYSTSAFQLSKFPPISFGATTDAGESNLLYLSNTEYPISAAALDNSGGFWASQNYGVNDQRSVLVRELIGNYTGVANSTIATGSGTYEVTEAQCGTAYYMNTPVSIAITRYGNAVVATYADYSVDFITGGTSGGTCTQLNNNTGSTTGNLGTKFGLTSSVATDGRDFVYVLNNFGQNTGVDGSVTVVNAQGESTGVSSVYAMNLLWSPQYQPSGTLTSMLSRPQNMALDPSGNIWVTNSTSTGNYPNSVVEIIGAAAPTTTPLASAVCTGTVGCIGYAP